MNTLYIDCASGMSGDMMLAAFVNMGMPITHIENEISKLGIGKEFRFLAENRNYQGKSVTDIDVKLEDESVMRLHPYSGRYRNYRDILRMIDESKLSTSVKTLSRKIFAIKAEAEAVVHDVPLEEVQFHEKGAVDSIVDIVGAAIGFDYFDISEAVATEVPTGYGSVQCACGELPVPAPAVKQILHDTGLPHYRSNVKQELLTPTGAAILAGTAKRFDNAAEPKNIVGCGHGVGKRETGLPPLSLTLCSSKAEQ